MGGHGEGAKAPGGGYGCDHIDEGPVHDAGCCEVAVDGLVQVDVR